MAIWAELGHLINVNKVREGIKCHQNNAHACISVERKVFYGKQDRKGFSPSVVINVAAATVPTMLSWVFALSHPCSPHSRKKVPVSPLEAATGKDFSARQTVVVVVVCLYFEIQFQFTFTNGVRENEIQCSVSHRITILITYVICILGQSFKFDNSKE